MEAKVDINSLKFTKPNVPSFTGTSTAITVSNMSHYETPYISIITTASSIIEFVLYLSNRPFSAQTFWEKNADNVWLLWDWMGVVCGSGTIRIFFIIYSGNHHWQVVDKNQSFHNSQFLTALNKLLFTDITFQMWYNFINILFGMSFWYTCLSCPDMNLSVILSTHHTIFWCEFKAFFPHECSAYLACHVHRSGRKTSINHRSVHTNADSMLS